MTYDGSPGTIHWIPQSTFWGCNSSAWSSVFIHLTSHMLRTHVSLAHLCLPPHLTCRSLVALDELGRGTATLDGAAIASAVLSHMAHTVGCRGLFATHYHHLASEHACDPAVSIMHMACAVGGQEEAEVDGTAGTTEVEEVTFLYKLAPGRHCVRQAGLCCNDAKSRVPLVSCTCHLLPVNAMCALPST
jgi:hypothetical protein